MFQHSEAVESVVIDNNIGNDSAGVSQSVDGVFLVTTSGLYCCQPKTSPEKLFLELAVNSTDTSAADILAITSGLDVNKLYEVGIGEFPSWVYVKRLITDFLRPRCHGNVDSMLSPGCPSVTHS